MEASTEGDRGGPWGAPPLVWVNGAARRQSRCFDMHARTRQGVKLRTTEKQVAELEFQKTQVIDMLHELQPERWDAQGRALPAGGGGGGGGGGGASDRAN
jgi:hypothetical protein